MGTLVGIYVSDRKGGPMRPLDRAELVSGQGIVGDRYAAGAGTFSKAVHEPEREVTLVEAEQVSAFNAAYGAAVQPGDLRRNLITSGVRLNDLVGAEFSIGDVVLRGIRLCEPCSYLASKTGREVLDGLPHRAGLRAGIVRGGAVCVNDAVVVPDGSS